MKTMKDEVTIAIEIKLKMQRDYFNPHLKSFPLLTVVDFKKDR